MSQRPAVFRSCLTGLAAAMLSLPASALELPLPPPGEDVVGEVRVVEARYEDTFAEIAKNNDLGYGEMVEANPGIDPWLPGTGAKITLPTRFILPPGPREGIVINLAEYRMYYFPAGRNVVYTYPLGIGREGWGSPVGVTEVTGKIPNPTWTPPASIRAEHAAEGDILPAVVPAGPDNPLGPFKFTLGVKGYLIHGSNKKFGIGMRVSHGCFRMLNNNVLELGAMVPVGTRVRVINQPYKFGVAGGQVYLEAHTPLDDNGDPSIVDKHAEVLRTLAQNPRIQAVSNLDWEMLRDVTGAESGLPEAVAAVTNPGAVTQAVQESVQGGMPQDPLEALSPQQAFEAQQQSMMPVGQAAVVSEEQPLPALATPEDARQMQEDDALEQRLEEQIRDSAPVPAVR